MSDAVAAVLEFAPRDQLDRALEAITSAFAAAFQAKWPHATAEEAVDLIAHGMDCVAVAYSCRLEGIRRRRAAAEAASQDHTLDVDEAAAAAHAVVDCDREAPFAVSGAFCTGMGVAFASLDPTVATALMCDSVAPALHDLGLPADERVTSADACAASLFRSVSDERRKDFGLDWLTAAFGRFGFVTALARAAVSHAADCQAGQPTVALLSVPDEGVARLLRQWVEALENAVVVRAVDFSVPLLTRLPKGTVNPPLVLVECGSSCGLNRRDVQTVRQYLATLGAAAPRVVMVSHSAAPTISAAIDHRHIRVHASLLCDDAVALARRWEAETAFLPFTSRWALANRLVEYRAQCNTDAATYSIWERSQQQSLTKEGPQKSDQHVIAARRQAADSIALAKRARANTERCIACLRPAASIATALELCYRIVREMGDVVADFDVNASLRGAALHRSFETKTGATSSIVVDSSSDVDDDLVEQLENQALEIATTLAEQLVSHAARRGEVAFAQLWATVWLLRKRMVGDGPRSPAKSNIGEPQLSFLDYVVGAALDRERKRRDDRGTPRALSEAALTGLCDRRVMSLRAQAMVLGLAPTAPSDGAALAERLDFLRESFEWRRRVAEVEARVEESAADAAECQVECLMAIAEWDRSVVADMNAVGLAVATVHSALDGLRQALRDCRPSIAEGALLHAQHWNAAAVDVIGSLTALMEGDHSNPDRLVAIRPNAANAVRDALRLRSCEPSTTGSTAAELDVVITQIRHDVLGLDWKPDAPTDVPK